MEDIYITTRSFGFLIHFHPFDYWRYEVEDFKKIFKDFEIIKLQKDPEAPGVFLKARKPFNYSPINLNKIGLYSILLGRRTKKYLISKIYQYQEGLRFFCLKK